MNDLTALAEAVGVLAPDDDTPTPGDLVAALGMIALSSMAFVSGSMLV